MALEQSQVCGTCFHPSEINRISSTSKELGFYPKYFSAINILKTSKHTTTCSQIQLDFIKKSTLQA